MLFRLNLYKSKFIQHRQKQIAVVNVERASEVIFGYTAANDVTARDWQKHDGQWARAKGFDTFCPLGPWISTHLSLEDAGRLDIATTLNGEARQESNTAQMVYSIPRLIEFVTSFTTLLPGDVLLTEAFEVIANASATPQICVAAARALGAGAGSRGMVYGQELDLKYEALAATEEQLRLIHRNKTGALINAAVQMGAAAAGATPQQCKILASYAYGLGLVFQIVDDVLDVTSTPEQLGKPIGSDSENGKTTFVTLYGIDGAMVLAQKLNEQICNDLQQHFGAKAAFLQQLAQQLLVRKN